MLEGTTDEVVVSFLLIYKRPRNMDAAGRLFNFSWLDPDMTEKQAL